jgi:MYXO-CTERM domain-containing protein
MTDKPAEICFDEQIIDSNGISHPEIEIKNTTLQFQTQGKGGAQLVKPGAPILTTYEITNWTDQTFEAIFTIGSNNSNNPVIFEPTSEDDAGYTYNLSEGEGDDFPMEIDSEKGDYDPCFPLPTPASSISPSASFEVNLPAMGSKTIEVYTRNWGNCEDGSCSGMLASIEGTFTDGTDNYGCAGGIIVVDSGGNGGGIEGCTDGGNPSDVYPCEGDEPEDDPCYEYVFFAPEHEPVGLRLSGVDGMALAILLLGTDSDSGASAHETDVHNISANNGRIVEEIFLANAPGAGTEVVLVSSFKVQAGSPEGRGLITELSIGDKYSPDDTVAHSFIGLGEAVVAGVPNAMFQLQLQESIWAVDPTNGRSVEVPIESGGFVVDEEFYTVTIGFTVPESGANSYILTHDMRAFVLAEFETDCADGADNDNDGLVDCDDDDCAAHPACTEDTGESQTDSGDSGMDDEDGEGCGCSSQPNKSSGMLAIFLATLIGWRRRRP